MKKVFFAAIVAVTLATSSFAADTKVNDRVAYSFKNDFAKAQSVKWGTAGKYVSATFVENNETVKAFYSVAGDLVGTSRSIGVDQLPMSAKRLLGKKYSDHAVKEAITFEQEGEITYYVSVENDKQSVILEVKNGLASIFKKTSKI